MHVLFFDRIAPVCVGRESEVVSSTGFASRWVYNQLIKIITIIWIISKSLPNLLTGRYPTAMWSMRRTDYEGIKWLTRTIGTEIGWGRTLTYFRHVQNWFRRAFTTLIQPSWAASAPESDRQTASQKALLLYWWYLIRDIYFIVE